MGTICQYEFICALQCNRIDVYWANMFTDGEHEQLLLVRLTGPHPVSQSQTLYAVRKAPVIDA